MNLHEQWFITATQAGPGAGAPVGVGVGDGEGSMVGAGGAVGAGLLVGSGSGAAVGVGAGVALGSNGRSLCLSRVHPASTSPASPSITIAARAVCAIFRHIMSDTLQFSNVTAVAKANVYFEGKVVSHTIMLADGKKKTLGLIYPGEYHFATDAGERMDITAGRCKIRLDGDPAWRTIEAGAAFEVPAKSGFDIVVAADAGIAQYICSFE